MKSAVLFALLIPVGCFAQSTSDSGERVPGNAAPPLLQRPYEAVRDFLNLYGYANGTFDTNGYYLNLTGGNSGSSAGVTAGGGVSGYQESATSVLELSYRGDYRTYQASSFPSGNEQNLSFVYRKDFTPRWSFTISEAAGIVNNGGTFYSSAPNTENPSNIVQANPFNAETRFTGTNLSLTYQKSARLSFEFGGSYFITRYSGIYSFGGNDITGNFSTRYRITRRTTFSGTYSRSNFVYKHHAGSTDVDNFFLTLTHDLGSHWTVSGSGGISRATSNGNVEVPLYIQVGQQIVSAVGIGHYSETSILPYYQGTLTHNLRHDSVSISGGQSVTPGNGIYLASRTLGFNGLWIHSMRRSNVSIAGYFSRLSSVANTISNSETTRGISASYAYNLVHHIGLNGRYDLIDYSSFGSYGGRADNRLSFGVYVTSKDIPLGLF